MSVRPLLAWICLLGVVKPRVPRVLVAATLNWYQRPGRMSPSLAPCSVVCGGGGGSGKSVKIPTQSQNGGKTLTNIAPRERKVRRITVGERLHAGSREGLLISKNVKYSFSFIRFIFSSRFFRLWGLHANLWLKFCLLPAAIFVAFQCSFYPYIPRLHCQIPYDFYDFLIFLVSI